MRGENPQMQTRKLVLAVFACIAGFACGLPAASAQEVSVPSGTQIFVAPYLWLGGVYGTTATPLARITAVNSSVGPFQLLGHLDGAPFMGSAEIHDGRISLLGDVVHRAVSTE